MTDLCYLACAAQAARRAAAHLSAVRHPQCAHRRDRSSRTAGGVEGYEFQRLHGMGEALYEALLARDARRRLPHLCAGRRPSRSARLSGAPAAGERRQLVLRVGRGRSATCRSPRSCSAPQQPDRRRASRAPSAHSAAARSLWRRRAAIRAASSSAIAQRSTRCWRSRAASPSVAEAAPLIDGVALTGTRAPVAVADRRRNRRHGGRSATRRSSIAAMAAAQAGFPAWDATPVASARRRARARGRPARGAIAAA